MQPQQPYQQPGQPGAPGQYPPQPTPPPQPAPTPMPGPPQPHEQYDFILNPAPPVKKSPFNFGGGSNLLSGKLFVILGGVFVVAIILAIVVNLTSSSGFEKDKMLVIAQDQTEIARLVEFGEENSTSQALKNFNATALLTTKSDQAAFLAYISTNGLKPKEKTLALKYDATADTKLDAAKTTGTFDTSYKEVIDQKLTAYQTDLKAAYENAGPNGKKVLETSYNNVNLLRQKLADN